MENFFFGILRFLYVRGVFILFIPVLLLMGLDGSKDLESNESLLLFIAGIAIDFFFESTWAYVDNEKRKRIKNEI
ncbi:hypothetical protein C1H87_01250 [Flavivirga eckloniae]|uniref:Uncharacterized protein n=1 Tax=Flavivirga eckloniae TaxID=1803846 RepID=A0A2K9PLF7_9FLAO|nr:hypothetical protein C1H87_01250 [Flavivirga eckloniae]